MKRESNLIKVSTRIEGLTSNLQVMVDKTTFEAMEWYGRPHKKMPASSVCRMIIKDLCDRYLLPVCGPSLDKIARDDARDVAGLIHIECRSNYKMKVEDFLKLKPAVQDQYLAWARRNFNHCYPAFISLLMSIDEGRSLPHLSPKGFTAIVERNRK